MVEFRQPPIDQLQHFVCMIDNDVLWLDVAMHDALGVAVVQRLTQSRRYLHELEHVESDIQIRQAGE